MCENPQSSHSVPLIVQMLTSLAALVPAVDMVPAVPVVHTVLLVHAVPVVPSQGFVRENPTAPIQLVRRRAPPCLNDFCRLGCVCSSLSHCSRTSHCGRPACMFGCSCLKQKVVLLKNLDGSDSSPSRHGNKKKKKRKRRMKMAYSKC